MAGCAGSPCCAVPCRSPPHVPFCSLPCRPPLPLLITLPTIHTLYPGSANHPSIIDVRHRLLLPCYPRTLSQASTYPSGSLRLTRTGPVHSPTIGPFTHTRYYHNKVDYPRHYQTELSLQPGISPSSFPYRDLPKTQEDTSTKNVLLEIPLGPPLRPSGFVGQLGRRRCAAVHDHSACESAPRV